MSTPKRNPKFIRKLTRLRRKSIQHSDCVELFNLSRDTDMDHDLQCTINKIFLDCGFDGKTFNSVPHTPQTLFTKLKRATVRGPADNVDPERTRRESNQCEELGEECQVLQTDIERKIAHTRCMVRKSLGKYLPVQFCKSVEQEMFNLHVTRRGYLDLCQKIRFNLRRNPVLKQKLFDNVLTPYGLCILTPYEMATTALRTHIDRVRDQLFIRATSSYTSNCSDVCPECKEQNAFYEQIQTRSADEGMTVRYICLSCRKTWRQD